MMERDGQINRHIRKGKVKSKDWLAVASLKLVTILHHPVLLFIADGVGTDLLSDIATIAC